MGLKGCRDLERMGCLEETTVISKIISKNPQRMTNSPAVLRSFSGCEGHFQAGALRPIYSEVHCLILLIVGGHVGSDHPLDWSSVRHVPQARQTFMLLTRHSAAGTLSGAGDHHSKEEIGRVAFDVCPRACMRAGLSLPSVHSINDQCRMTGATGRQIISACQICGPAGVRALGGLRSSSK